jgi:hypothetical protein
MSEWTSPAVRGRRTRGPDTTRTGLEYIGQGTIARHFGVSRPAVSNWIKRDIGVPRPDATVDGVPVWLKDRLPEWERWFHSIN